MSVRRYRFASAAGIAALALFVAPAREALAQQTNLSSTQPLRFGSFVPLTGGTVTVSPNGARSRSGAVVLVNSPASQAVFTASRNGGGNKSLTADIVLPSNGTIRLTNGANSMAVDNFVSLPAAGLKVSLTSPGTVSVGATLSVAPNQPPGEYAGSFQVTVTYN